MCWPVVFSCYAGFILNGLAFTAVYGKQFDVQGSHDGENWTDLAQLDVDGGVEEDRLRAGDRLGTVLEGRGAPTYYPIDNTDTYSYVRFGPRSGRSKATQYLPFIRLELFGALSQAEQPAPRSAKATEAVGSKRRRSEH